MAEEVIPSGTVVAFAGPSAPAGWLRCDGTAVKITDYANLHKAIGFIYGKKAGDNTVFYLPDYRGYFLRGTDAGTGRDPGPRSKMNPAADDDPDGLGTVEGDAFASHHHRGDVALGGGGNVGKYMNEANPEKVGDSWLQTGDTGGSETRPRNASVQWIIKA